MGNAIRTFAATKAAGAVLSPPLSPVAPCTKTETRNVLPAPFPSLVATDPPDPESVSSMVTCSDTCEGARPSGCSNETVMDTASPLANRVTVFPKNST